MPTAYGGGDNPPVRLDPWQEIVNVHWRRRFLRLTVLYDHSSAFATAPTDPYPPLDPPVSTIYAYYYLSVANFFPAENPNLTANPHFPDGASTISEYDPVEDVFVQIEDADQVDIQNFPAWSFSDSLPEWGFLTAQQEFWPDDSHSVTPDDEDALFIQDVTQVGGATLSAHYPTVNNEPFVDSLVVELRGEAVIPIRVGKVHFDVPPGDFDSAERLYIGQVPQTSGDMGISHEVDFSAVRIAYDGIDWVPVGMLDGTSILFAPA